MELLFQGSLTDLPTTLVVAHPGHELRVHAWLEKLKPEVFIITDGSGTAHVSRIDASTETIKAAGAKLHESSAQWSDQEAYKYLLSSNIAAVIALIENLANALQQKAVRLVICDAIEGYNPVHDLSSVITFFASKLANRNSEHDLVCFDFPLENRPDSRAKDYPDASLVLKLTASEWQRKLAAISRYAVLQHEVERSFRLHGKDSFRVEVLTPMRLQESLAMLNSQKPFYERHGEKRVAEGTYNHVLRYKEHFLPLFNGVSDWFDNK